MKKKNRLTRFAQREVAPLLSILAFCTGESPAKAQEQTNSPVQTTVETNSTPSAAVTGLLPIPDYSGNLWTRSYLTGDWFGVRTNLANKGVQFNVQLNQYVQDVANGGKNNTTQYGGNVDYLLNLDLMQMGILPGALIKIRAESRYGNSVNGQAGPLLPVNTTASFPLTPKLDEDVPFTIIDLNYTQFLSEYLGVFFGKLDTLDGDLNEFASGRGTSQFMNANFLFNPALALRLPYSTLGVGVVWMPIPPGPKGGVTVSSSVINTADSSTTTGFNDFGDGQSWTTEADFQYRLGHLPGGMNVGALYSFNQDFAKISSRAIFEPGQGIVIPSQNYTWAVYWSGWQYLFTKELSDKPIDLANGEPDLQGIGLFSRVGLADKNTNPTDWAISGGIGGRGMIPSRDNDLFGVGYFYNHIESSELFPPSAVRSYGQGFEAFYNIALTPACHVTLDVQVVEPAAAAVQTVTILGMRASLAF
jgi:porin